ncbi:hypothetical protein Gogos_019828 [Gossypium gossypioides]|uniref:Uncharacterized protein n=1 Tax=Gossypium gossypioides TaxID=34282 RepID=A0A7J9D486_GOSGO|nr:hypothetical protein [Gossypium gossypioides]
MNGISNALNGLCDISGIEVGQHFYWEIAGSVVIAVRNPQTIPTADQNFFEHVLEFIREVSKTHIGEEYGPWVPFIGTMFLFIFVSNWSGALLPWKIIQLPHGELAAPTNDINTTVALVLLTEVVKELTATQTILKKMGSKNEKLGGENMDVEVKGMSTISLTVFFKAKEIVEKPKSSDKVVAHANEKSQKFEGRVVCHYCGIAGHTWPKCYKLLKDLGRNHPIVPQVATQVTLDRQQKHKFVFSGKDKKCCLVAHHSLHNDWN